MIHMKYHALDTTNLDNVIGWKFYLDFKGFNSEVP